MMRAARLVLFTAVALLAVAWGAMLTSTMWTPAEEDLGVGLLVVGGFMAGHAVVLALATTAAVLAACARRGAPAARRFFGVPTLTAAVALATIVAACLGFLVWF